MSSNPTYKRWPGPSVFALICARVDDPGVVVREGAKEEKCFNCGHAIVANRESLEMKAKRGDKADYLCLVCWASFYVRPTGQKMFQNRQPVTAMPESGRPVSQVVRRSADAPWD